jgi:ArsR family transcriptional regulator, arsenate/arsenite/antimonite-responsive transcriptional repressor
MQGHLTALADPTRLSILSLLRRQDHCVCHLVASLGLKQSVISHHVGILRRAGLVRSYPHPRDRRWLYYQIDRMALRDIAATIGWLMDDSEYNPGPLPCAADASTTGAE